MRMKRIFYLLTIVAMLVACSESYNIKGSSSVSLLDGSKLYLKVMESNGLKNFDSCEVVHGDFRFTGTLDTTQMAALYMDDRDIMPLVIEKGNISIRIEDAVQKVSGTPLNDALYDFLDQYRQLGNQMAELDHRYGQMLLDGISEQQIEEELSGEAMLISNKEDSLVTSFVIANFDNVLGPYVFVRMSSSVPQVEHVMSQAPDAFKNDPLVVEFYNQVTKMPGLDKAEAPALSADQVDDATIQDILNGK